MSTNESPIDITEPTQASRVVKMGMRNDDELQGILPDPVSPECSQEYPLRTWWSGIDQKGLTSMHHQIGAGKQEVKPDDADSPFFRESFATARDSPFRRDLWVFLASPSIRSRMTQRRNLLFHDLQDTKHD